MIFLNIKNEKTTTYITLLAIMGYDLKDMGKVFGGLVLLIVISILIRGAYADLLTLVYYLIGCAVLLAFCHYVLGGHSIAEDIESLFSEKEDDDELEQL